MRKAFFAVRFLGAVLAAAALPIPCAFIDAERAGAFMSVMGASSSYSIISLLPLGRTLCGYSPEAGTAVLSALSALIFLSVLSVLLSFTYRRGAAAAGFFAGAAGCALSCLVLSACLAFLLSGTWQAEVFRGIISPGPGFYFSAAGLFLSAAGNAGLIFPGGEDKNALTQGLKN